MHHRDRGHAGEGAERISAERRARAIVGAALRVLKPGDAEARLRWLLHFSEQDLARLSAGKLVAEQIRLMFVVGQRRDWAARGHFTPASGAFTVDAQQRQVLERISSRLRTCFHALAGNQPFALSMPRAGRWVLQRTAIGGGWEMSVGRVRHWGSEPVLLAVRLLQDVGAGKLRTCPLRRKGEDAPCGRLFLARRRQRYCSVKHSRAAAFAAWLTAQGGTRAKK